MKVELENVKPMDIEKRSFEIITMKVLSILTVHMMILVII